MQRLERMIKVIGAAFKIIFILIKANLRKLKELCILLRKIFNIYLFEIISNSNSKLSDLFLKMKFYNLSLKHISLAKKYADKILEITKEFS